MLINGQPGTLLSAQDRGLAYGDGIYRTLEVKAGHPLLWRWHWQRLAADCLALRLPCPEEALLLQEIGQVCADLPRAVVKVMLTRGEGPRGYAMPEVMHPTRIVSAAPWGGYPPVRAEEGVCVRWCLTPLAIQPRLAGIKHLNRLENVLARSEWSDPGVAEGLMCDTEGSVVEGTMTNLFMVRSGVLITPVLDRCGVSGALRAWLMEAAASLGLSVREIRLSRECLLQADEVFIGNSLAGLWPVTRLDERAWPVGALTRRLQACLAVERG